MAVITNELMRQAIFAPAAAAGICYIHLYKQQLLMTLSMGRSKLFECQ